MRLRIDRKQKLPGYMNIVVPVVSTTVAFLIMGLILVVFFSGEESGFGEAFSTTIEAYTEMFSWPFGNIYGFYDTIMKMIPLAFVGLDLSFVYRMKIWNIR